jgi:hypothetical protein
VAFNNKVKTAQNAKATTALTGAAPQVGTGNTVLMSNVVPGTLSAKMALSCKTSNITQTPSWQVSADNSTWVDFKGVNNPAQVATAGGTGSQVVTTIVLEGPPSLSGWRYVRAITTTAVGVGDGSTSGDAYTISYSWLQADQF